MTTPIDPQVAPVAPTTDPVAKADTEVKQLTGVVSQLQPQLKPGLKTTEFIVTAVMVLGSLAGSLFHKQLDISNYTVLGLDIVSGVITLSYLLARTALKFGVAKGVAHKVLTLDSALEK